MADGVIRAPESRGLCAALAWIRLESGVGVGEELGDGGGGGGW